jgi:hypothetical protein
MQLKRDGKGTLGDTGLHLRDQDDVHWIFFIFFIVISDPSITMCPQNHCESNVYITINICWPRKSEYLWQPKTEKKTEPLWAKFDSAVDFEGLRTSCGLWSHVKPIGDVMTMFERYVFLFSCYHVQLIERCVNLLITTYWLFLLTYSELTRLNLLIPLLWLANLLVTRRCSLPRSFLLFSKSVSQMSAS